MSPLNLVFCLLAAGAVLMSFSRRLGRLILVTGLLLFLVPGLIPIGPSLLAGLENRYTRPEPPPQAVSGIIVLGGTFEGDISRSRRIIALNDNAERVLEGLRLARQYPEALLIFSGGEGRLLRKDHPEAADAEAFLAENGFEPPAVFFEDESRNTWENAVFTKKLFEPQPGETWLLVTSAWHMPRAMGVFRQAGWSGVVPWPTDYRTDGYTGLKPRRFDVGGNFHKADMALHEYAGFAAYYMTGKIALPPSVP